jgi:hypothetical protein
VTTAGPTAELTAHLRRLAERLDDLDTRAGQLTEALTNQIVPQLDQLRGDTTDQLAHHTRPVQHLIDTLTPHTTPPADWSTMDAERAATEWDALARWVAHTLVPWNEITRDQPVVRPASERIAHPRRRPRVGGGAGAGR